MQDATQKETEDKIFLVLFGAPAILPDTGCLYTLKEVLAAVSLEAGKDTFPSQANYETVEKLVRFKFLQGNPKLPLISESSATKKMERDMENVRLLDSHKLSAKKKKNLLSRLDKIFDLVLCQCQIVDCGEDHDCSGAHVLCKCPKEIPRIPDMEAAWLRDQRQRDSSNQGKYMMKGIDWKVAAAQQKQLNKIAAKNKAEQNRQAKLDKKAEEVEEEVENFEMPIADEDDRDTDFEFKSKAQPKQNRTNLNYFIAEVIRYGYSDRGAAALYNAALKTVGKIVDGRDSLAVDKNKIRRARDSFGTKQKLKLATQVGATGGLQCIGADGKRNKKTKQKVTQIINNCTVEKIVTKPQEHIVYTQEPGGTYLQHSEIAPNRGTGQDLADDFLEVVIENNSEASLEAVVADGTNTNTGWRDGCIAHLERKIHPARPLLWLICQAHGNELPLRALFTHCDGGHGTSGPDSFKGPLGQACTGDVHLGNIAKFTPISTSLPDLDESVWRDLSRDQKLLYRYAKAIAAGSVSDNLAAQVAGPSNHSRWHTSN